MENSRRIIELLLALALVGILFLVSIAVIQNQNSDSGQTSAQYITNSYNNYNYHYNSYPLQDSYHSQEMISETYWKKDFDERKFNYIHDGDDLDKNYYDYDKYASQKTREDLFGSYIKEYYVYILNKEDTGKYFTVVFEFEDKDGHEYQESVTKYLSSGEKEKFAYKAIQFEENDILDWDYRIIPKRA